MIASAWTGERYDQTNVGPLIYVALSSPIPVVIENAVRYLQIQNEAGKESVAASKLRGDG